MFGWVDMGVSKWFVSECGVVTWSRNLSPPPSIENADLTVLGHAELSQEGL